MTQSDENLTHKVRQLSVSDKKNESAVAKEQSSKIELQQEVVKAEKRAKVYESFQ